MSCCNFSIDKDLFPVKHFSSTNFDSKFRLNFGSYSFVFPFHFRSYLRTHSLSGFLLLLALAFQSRFCLHFPLNFPFREMPTASTYCVSIAHHASTNLFLAHQHIQKSFAPLHYIPVSGIKIPGVPGVCNVSWIV